MTEQEPEIFIKFFGEPEVTLDGNAVNLGSALPLLAVLLLWRRSSKGVKHLVNALPAEGYRPNSDPLDPASRLRKRKKILCDRLHLALPNNLNPAENAAVILARADVDMVFFEEHIESADTQQVRAAVALRQRGPLLAGWDQPGLIAEARAVCEKKYQAALWRLIQEGGQASPQETAQDIDLLLACAGVPERQVEALHEMRRTVEHEMFKEKLPTSGSKTTQILLPPKLPFFPTPLIGREAELDALQKLLVTPGLVTLMGTAGIGKTRLAVAAAHSLRENFPYEPGFADLTTVSEAGQLSQQIGLSLGLTEEKSRSWREALLAFLKDKTLLLIWDNCEHLVAACAELAADIVARCPAVRLLATSREPLRIQGERAFPVPALQEDHAAQLFLTRAQAVSFNFAPAPEHQAAILKICHDLDRLPLAIELAAAQVDIQTVQEIASNLDRRFQVLVDGPRAASPHYASLQAAFDGSYALLKPAEQALFCPLGVFAGSFSREAAAAVSAAERAPEAADILSRLVRKSLIVTEARGEEMRYRLLVTVRQYAQDRLREQGKWEELCRRHRAYFLSLAEEAEPHLRGPDQKFWLERLETEHDNFREALGWRGDDTALRLANALFRFWWMRGHLKEGRDWLDRKKDSQTTAGAARAAALNNAGSLALYQGDFQESRRLHEQSLAAWTELGDESGMADALCGLGLVIAHADNYEEAKPLLTRSLTRKRQSQDVRGIAAALNALAMVANYQCDYDAAKAFLEESLALLRPLADARGIANASYNLGIIAIYQGKHEYANALFAESLAQWRRLGDTPCIANSLNGLGETALRQGCFATAKKHFHESLELRQNIGDKYGIANCVNGLGEVAMHQGDLPTARELLEESLVSRQQIGDKPSIPYSLCNLGQLALSEKNPQLAHVQFLAGLKMMWQNEDRYGAANALEGLASVTFAFGQPESAARLLGAAESLYHAIRSPRPPQAQEDFHHLHAALRHTLSEAKFTNAWEQGQAMTWAQMVAYALDEELPG